MNPIDFLKTVYFGDRYCTKITINSQSNEVEIHLNLISRIRDKSGEWNFYTEEDIDKGILVFFGVTRIYFDQSGLIPNDEIYDIKAIEINENLYEFVINSSNVDKNSLTTDLSLRILSEGVYLLDPNNVEDKIVN